jgi:hypothetical protein
VSLSIRPNAPPCILNILLFLLSWPQVRCRVDSITTFQCGTVIKVAGAGPSEHVRLSIAFAKPESTAAAAEEADGHVADSQAAELEALASAEVLVDPERSDHFVFAEDVVVSLAIDELPPHSPIFAPGSQCAFVGWSATRECTVEVPTVSLFGLSTLGLR